MTLTADTPETRRKPGLLTDLAHVFWAHRPWCRRRPPDEEPPSTDDALVRALCHDMCSPLASLEATLGALGRTPEYASELVDLARAQTAHLSSMLRTADATGGAPERRGTRPLVDVLRASAAASGLPRQQLTVQLGEDADQVQVADARVQRVLTNLLENAHRHGEGRPVRLCAERRGAWVHLAVTQAGVPADAVVSRLSQETPPVDLDGLGLWSVQRQTRELGGRLLWSLAADGAFTLTVRLPDR